jgi:hypothetical protein
MAAEPERRRTSPTEDKRWGNRPTYSWKVIERPVLAAETNVRVKDLSSYSDVFQRIVPCIHAGELK